MPETTHTAGDLPERLMDYANFDLDDVDEAAATIVRLSERVRRLEAEVEQLKEWVPLPTEMSGYDDPGAEGDYLLEAIAEACEIHGYPIPPHIAAALSK